jgi:hypothetical protein
MKFSEHENYAEVSRYFQVHVADSELADFGGNRGRYTMFSHMVMIRLANMIAAYIYKTRKDEWAAFVESEDFNRLVVEAVANRISVKVQAR